MPRNPRLWVGRGWWDPHFQKLLCDSAHPAGAGQLLWTWDPAWGSWARGVTCLASSKATLTLRVWAGFDLSVKALVGKFESLPSSVWPEKLSLRALCASQPPSPQIRVPPDPSTSASAVKAYYSFNSVFHLNITTSVLIQDSNLPSVTLLLGSLLLGSRFLFQDLSLNSNCRARTA